jgi:hypothetical protein
MTTPLLPRAEVIWILAGLIARGQVTTVEQAKGLYPGYGPSLDSAVAMMLKSRTKTLTQYQWEAG